jgi:hypothetical protein
MNIKYNHLKASNVHLSLSQALDGTYTVIVQLGKSQRSRSCKTG